MFMEVNVKIKKLLENFYIDKIIKKKLLDIVIEFL